MQKMPFQGEAKVKEDFPDQEKKSPIKNQMPLIMESTPSTSS